MYLYHYCIFTEKSPGVSEHVYGFYERDEKMKTGNDCEESLEALAKYAGIETSYTLISLTLLHADEDFQ